MFQTRLDRWLRERFVYETHIYAMRPASKVPRGVRATELAPIPGRQYRIEYVACSKAAAILIEHLKHDGQMFTTRIVDRTSWFVPIIAPQGKSATWRAIWGFVGIIILLLIAFGMNLAWSNQEFRKNVLESLEILKG
jgi:hypothetical protein